MSHTFSLLNTRMEQYCLAVALLACLILQYGAAAFIWKRSWLQFQRLFINLLSMIRPSQLLVFLDFWTIGNARILLFCQTWSDAWMGRHLLLPGVDIGEGIPKPSHFTFLTPIHLQRALSTFQLRQMSLRNISAILLRGGTPHWIVIFCFLATSSAPGRSGAGRRL